MPRPSSDNNILTELRAGNVRTVSRILTRIENRDPSLTPLLKALYPYTGRATLIGITGPAGAGKSTLIDRLIKSYRRSGQSIGVLAIDPSSPFSGGALLGDRVRMHQHFLDPEVYIRSLSAPATWGGISPALFDAIHVLDVMGKDIILIETIGVGQNEVRIAGLAEILILVLSPGMGDEIQTLKAGLLETGDLVAVTKCDQHESASLQNHLHEMAPDRPVIGISATEEVGMEMLIKQLESLRKQEKQEKRESFSRSELQSLLYEQLQKRGQTTQFSEETIRQVAKREKNPYDTLEDILK